MGDTPRTKRGVFIALALIVAVGATAVAYRFIGERPANSASRASATIKVGGQNFVRWETPRAVPVVAFEDERGGRITLEEFHGRVVLLNVWATWCVPCRKEMPTLDRLQAMLGGPGFEVVALSIDQGGAAEVRKFYREIGIRRLRIYNDPVAEATARLNVLGVPATLLIDSAGREVGRALGPAEWDAPDVVTLIRSQLDRSPR